MRADKKLSFFSTSLLRTAYFLSLTYRHVSCALEDSLLQTSERDSLPENKVHRHFAEESVPALITAFLLLLLTFFLTCSMFYPLRNAPLKSICTFAQGKKHPPFSLSILAMPQLETFISDFCRILRQSDEPLSVC